MWKGSEREGAVVCSGKELGFISWFARDMQQHYHIKRLKVLYSCNRTPSHRYGISFAIWDHTVLPATQQVNTPPVNSSIYRPVLNLPTLDRWKAEWPRWPVTDWDCLPIMCNQYMCKLSANSPKTLYVHATRPMPITANTPLPSPYEEAWAPTAAVYAIPDFALRSSQASTTICTFAINKTFSFSFERA